MLERMARSFLLSSALLFLGAPLAIAAEPDTPADSAGGKSDELEEIIVTATKVGETTVQKTPLAVSVFSGEALGQTNTADIAGLAELSPSLNVGVVTASPSIYIRGVGTNNVFNGSDPDVTMQVDGVYVARPFEQFSDFLDVHRIEVLRGPQGTIYGRNAVGGVVNIVSRAPSDHFVGTVEVGGGNHDAQQERLYLSGPIVDGLLNASLAANHDEHGPYDDNLVPGLHGVGDGKNTSARLQALLTPSAAVSATTRLDYGKSDEAMQSYDHLLAPLPFPADLANSAIGDYHDVALSDPGGKSTRSYGAAEDVVFKLSDELSLRSLTAYRYGKYHLNLDFDASEFPAAVILQAEKSRQFSQELNLVGKFEQFDFVAGVYYLRDRQTTFNQAIAYVPGDEVFFETAPKLTAKSKAVYLQGTYRLPNGVGLTLGGRYTEDRKTLHQRFTVYDFTDAVLGPPVFEFTADLSPKFHAFTPKVGIDWQATDDAMFYASYTEGWKSGGTNYAASDLEGISFEPEKIKSYEVGARTQWLEKRLRLNLTAFKYNYDDLQVQQALRQGVIVINNAASADIKGVELELTGRPVPQLELSLDATYLDATYGHFPGSEVPEALAEYVADDPNYDPTIGEAGGYNAAGKRLNNAPKFAYVAAVRYSHEIPQGEIYGLANWRWQDSTDFDPSNAGILREPSYGLLTVGLGYNSRGDRWNVQALVKNALDEDYYVVRAANALVPTAFSGAPRTLMVSVARNF